MTSRILSWRGPRIGYARLVSAKNMSNQSQGMEYNTVINLGHSPKQPLISSPSELVDGLEPHDHVLLSGPAGHAGAGVLGVGGGVPGVGVLGGCQEG